MKKKVLGILGICAALGLVIVLLKPSLVIRLGYANTKMTLVAKYELEYLHLALDRYLLDVGQYPQTKDGLRALIENLHKDSKWRGPYFRKGLVPKDPWGNDFIYQRLENGFELSTLGADGKAGGSGEAEDIMVKGTPP